MYRRNEKHIQKDLLDLDPFSMFELQGEIEKTEEYFFYQTIFSQINEDIFAPLYCDNNGRPNAPVNSMVSALILKEKHNWTYKELFKEMKYNLLARAALGCFSLSGMPFNQATLFNFQNRLKDYEEKTGENLFEHVFDVLTAKQLKKLKLKTDIARTDSFMIDSNIRSYGRLQLLIEVILRLYRVLSKSDKKKFGEQFSSYRNSNSEHYIYHLKGSDLPHELSKITSLYYWIKLNLPTKYHSSNEYKIFLRVYEEHFKLDENDKFQMRDNSEISSSSLQSPDDSDATYRKKRGVIYHGQVGSIIETANPENDINLITDVAVVSNNTDDSKILNERFDKIGEKLPDLKELHFDGGYGSEGNDQKLAKMEVTPVQTAVKGKKSEVSMHISVTENNELEVSCPNEQTVMAESTRKRFKACFDKDICEQCPFKDKCPTIEQKKNRVYYFSESAVKRKQRHNSFANLPLDKRKIRANVEATMHEFTHRMRGHKLKVRGIFKTTLFVFATAIAINFGRIYRYCMKKGYLLFLNSLLNLLFSVFEIIFANFDPIYGYRKCFHEFT